MRIRYFFIIISFVFFMSAIGQQPLETPQKRYPSLTTLSLIEVSKLPKKHYQQVKKNVPKELKQLVKAISTVNYLLSIPINNPQEQLKATKLVSGLEALLQTTTPSWALMTPRAQSDNRNSIIGYLQRIIESPDSATLRDAYKKLRPPPIYEAKRRDLKFLIKLLHPMTQRPSDYTYRKILSSEHTIDAYMALVPKKECVSLLHKAAQFGNTSALSFIIDTYTTDPDAQDHHNATAMQVAVFYNKLEVVKSLLTRHANIRLPYYKDMDWSKADLYLPPVQMALVLGNLECIKIFSGTEPDILKEPMRFYGVKTATSLMLAARSGNTDLAYYLLHVHKIPINKRYGSFGETALSYAQETSLDMVKLLVAHNAQIEFEHWINYCVQEYALTLTPKEKRIGAYLCKKRKSRPYDIVNFHE